MVVEDDSYGAGWAPGDIKMVGYGPPALYVDGSGDYASSPDHSDFDVGDLDIRIAMVAPDWTPAAERGIFGKRVDTGDQESYGGSLDTTGKPRLIWSTNGSTILSRVSTVAVPIIDGKGVLARFVLDVDNGASGHDVKFYTLPYNPLTYFDDLELPGTEWSQLGTTVTTAGVTSIFASTAPLTVGRTIDTILDWTGSIMALVLKSSIDGTTVANPDFSRQLDRTAAFSDTSATPKTWSMNGNAYLQPGLADGWLFCDGSIYDITDFPDLFEAIGNNFGGDGSTTFAVPDFIGRFPLGLSTPGARFGAAEADSNFNTGGPSVGVRRTPDTGANNAASEGHFHNLTVPAQSVGYVIRAA